MNRNYRVGIIALIFIFVFYPYISHIFIDYSQTTIRAQCAAIKGFSIGYMPTSNLNMSFVIGNYIVVSIPNQGPLSYPYVKECVFQGDRIIIEVYIDNCFVPSSEKSESVCPLYGHEGSSSILIVGAKSFNKFNKIRVNIYTRYELETAKVNNLKLEKTVEFDMRFYSTMFRSLIVVIAFIFVRTMKLLFQRLPMR